MAELLDLPPWLVKGQKKLWGRLSGRALAALRLAEDEARRMNHDYLGTEHVLLGLLGQEGGVAADALQRGRSPSPGHPRGLRGLGIDGETVRSHIEEVVGRGTAAPPAELAVTPRTRRVIELAGDDARRRGAPRIGTEHLLVGLLGEPEGLGARILVQLGTDLPQAQGRLEEFSQKDAVVTCRVGQRESEAIDKLVQAGTCPTRSEAAAWLIAAGVDANADLFFASSDEIPPV